MRDVLAKLRSSLSVDIPTASKNGSYKAAAEGRLGVPTYDAGGKLPVASAHVLQKLGLADGRQPDLAGDQRPQPEEPKQLPVPKLKRRGRKAAAQKEGPPPSPPATVAGSNRPPAKRAQCDEVQDDVYRERVRSTTA
jgi:hypothetical protein